MTTVTYIGKKPFKDNVYGSGLTFENGQSRDVPELLAKNFLRHKDVFKPGGKVDAPKKKEDVKPDTEDVLKKAEQARKEQEQKENAYYDLRDQINEMNKEALELFARSKYDLELDRRLKVEKMREQVIKHIDQYGAY